LTEEVMLERDVLLFSLLEKENHDGHPYT